VYEKLRRLKWMDGVLGLGLGLIVVGLAMSLKTAGEEKKGGEFFQSRVTPTVVIGVSQVDNKVTFDIAGQVIRPGVYQLDRGSRVNEGLALAGGLAAGADREWVEKNINRAEIIRDGEKIYIPKKNEVLTLNNPAGQTGKVAGVNTGGLISLNTATMAQLDTLSGIGPALAQRIIDYRDKMGGFKDINEIKLVDGIGDKLYAQIKDKIGL